MDINSLTVEERAQLKAQFEAEEKNAVLQVQRERENYKKLVTEFCENAFTVLQEVSDNMLAVKGGIFKDAQALIALKNELFRVKGDRQSDSFSTADGRITIKLGNRIYEGWDDTVNVGIEKVKDYLSTLAKDENSSALVETVMGLLAKDRKGSLKASKVLELERLAVKTQDPGFLDGIRIIKEAYRPVPSCQFIEVRYKDNNGTEKTLPLSMSAFE